MNLTITCNRTDVPSWEPVTKAASNSSSPPTKLAGVPSDPAATGGDNDGKRRGLQHTHMQLAGSPAPYELPLPEPGQPAAMACAVAQVSTWMQLLSASVVLQQSAQRVYIVLTANITLPSNYSSRRNGSIEVYRDMHISSPVNDEKRTVMQLSTQNGEVCVPPGRLLMPGFGVLHVQLGPNSSVGVSAGYQDVNGLCCDLPQIHVYCRDFGG